MQDSLKTQAYKIIMAPKVEERFSADSSFTKGFVRALKIKNSFYFPFDSLQNISRMYAPDSSFRIFTWQLLVNENLVRQHGAIQMRTIDGSLKLLPLIDKSDVTINQRDTIANNFGWMGAVYYKIMLNTAGNKKYYTLLGFDDNNIRSDKRVIDVLSFSDKGEPIFGANIFAYDTAKGGTLPARIIMEFKKEASPRLTYDNELKMIVMEHLISTTGDVRKKYTLVPDGDYEGFKWVNGKWRYVSKIFNQVTPEGQSPIPIPLGESTIK